MRFSEIDDIEFVGSILREVDSKIKPLSGTSGVDIILQDQIILIGSSLSI